MNARLHHHGGWTLVELMVAILIISILAGLSLSVGSAILGSSDVRRTEDLLTLLDAASQEYVHTEGREPTYGKNGHPHGSEGVFKGSSYDIDLLATLQSDNGCDDCGVEFALRFDYTNNPGEWGYPEEPNLLCAQWLQVAGCSGGGEPVYEGTAALFFMLLNEVPASRTILSSVEPDLLEHVEVQVQVTGDVEEYHSIMPVDAWGNPILVVLPGHVRSDAGGFMDWPRKDVDGTVRTREELMLGPALRRRIYFVSAGPDGKFGDLKYEQLLTDSFDADYDDDEFLKSRDNIYSYEVVSW